MYLNYRAIKQVMYAIKVTTLNKKKGGVCGDT